MAAEKPKRGRSSPAYPHGLGPRGGAFWTQATTTYELSDSETELLLECCRLLDEVEALNDAIERDGLTVKGHAGQPRVHPAVTEVRQHRLSLGKLLAQLALPDEDGGTLLSPTQARAKRAASARWTRGA